MHRVSTLLAPAALAALGAAPGAQSVPVGPSGVPVINVEIDYMVDTDHSHMPQQDEIDALVQMFACHGIFLNLVVDDAIPHMDVIQCPDPDGDFFSCLGLQSFALLKATYFDNGPTGWHYCIFGHQYANEDGVTSSSGRGQIGGVDFIVTLGAFMNEVGTPFDRASTLAHELGHNLGLTHSPVESIGESGPYQPNYASVMSYQYQLTGVKNQMECLGLVGSAHRLKDLDYSSGRMPALLESGLDESRGLGMHSTDWDCDGAVDGSDVAQELDKDAPWCSESLQASVLLDHDDWAGLSDSSWSASDADSRVWPDAECITRKELDRLREEAGLQDPGACGTQPTLVVEPCAQGLMTWVDPTSNPLTQTGDGDHPYLTLEVAVGATPAGSVLYLAPGTHGGSAPIVIDQPRTIDGVGAVVDP